MPKSRNRRPSKSGKSVPRHRPRRSPRDELLGELGPWLEIMSQADAAESRGDAAGALELMMSRPDGPDGRSFWRPWRIRALLQLTMMDGILPSWVRSRWVLAQALQATGRRQDPVARRRRQQALDRAVELRGGVAALPGSDVTDALCRVVDRDWVYRQLHAYDLGGLASFVGRGATPDLLAGADDLRRWGSTPMGAYQFFGRTTDSELWMDVADRSTIWTPGLGGSIDLAGDAYVIGRLVPVEGDRRMFESAPLRVPLATARRVADDPPGWLDALRATDPSQLRTGPLEFGLISDVQHERWRSVVAPGVAGLPMSRVGPQVARAALDLAADALPALECDCTCREHLDVEDCDLWPCLAAALTEPAVAEALPEVVGAADAETLERLSECLSEPAASWCTRAAASLPGAA